MLSSYATLASFMKSGKVRALAVISAKPYPAFPDLPPLITVVPGYTNENWVGVLAPAGTPERIVERLNREINEIANAPDMRNLLEADGMVAVAVSPPGFAARIKQELQQWKQIAAARKNAVE